MFKGEFPCSGRYKESEKSLVKIMFTSGFLEIISFLKLEKKAKSYILIKPSN